MSATYTQGRQGLLDGSIPSWLSGTFKAALVGNAYAPDVVNHKFVTDIPSGAIVARTPTLTSNTAVGSVARAADVTFSAVSGPPIYYVVVYNDTGSDATSRLIALITTANGLPVTPNGGDITLSWDTGPNGIFAL